MAAVGRKEKGNAYEHERIKLGGANPCLAKRSPTNLTPEAQYNATLTACLNKGIECFEFYSRNPQYLNKEYCQRVGKTVETITKEFFKLPRREQTITLALLMEKVATVDSKRR